MGYIMRKSIVGPFHGTSMLISYLDLHFYPHKASLGDKTDSSMALGRSHRNSRHLYPWPSEQANQTPRTASPLHPRCIPRTILPFYAGYRQISADNSARLPIPGTKGQPCHFQYDGALLTP